MAVPAKRLASSCRKSKQRAGQGVNAWSLHFFQIFLGAREACGEEVQLRGGSRGKHCQVRLLISVNQIAPGITPSKHRDENNRAQHNRCRQSEEGTYREGAR